MTFQASLQSGFSGPLYQQVHDALKARIASGEWSGGMSIPGDAELSRQLGVSIGTVRKALDELARQSLVVRERGRGTFIKDPSSWRGDLESFLHDRLGRPLQSEIKLVESVTAPASAAEQKALRLAVARGALPQVHRLVRTWSHDGKAVVAERIVVDGSRLPALREEPDLTTPLLSAVYVRTLRRGIGRTEWMFGDARSAREMLSRFLSPTDDAALMAIHRVIYDAVDTPVEICDQLVDLRCGSYRLSR